MKKYIVALVLVLSFGSFSFAAKKRKVVKSAEPAAESKGSVKLSEVEPKKRHTSAAFQAWLKEMKKRISKTTTKNNQLVAVAAVRGDDTPDAPPLYWKGKKSEGQVASSEVADFEKAIDTAMTGDPMDAKEKLQSFLLAYPKSSMAADAQETLTRLDASTVNP